MKKLFLVPLMIILLGGLIFGGCAKPVPTPAPAPAPVPAPAPAPAPTPAPAPAPEVIKLRFSHHMPAVAANHKIYVEWAKRVNEQTQGRVEVEIFPAQALASAMDMYTSLVGGICDIAAVLTPFARDQFQVNSVLSQPIGPPPFLDGVHMWEQLYDKFPEIQAELDEVELLFTWVAGPMLLHTAKKEVRVPDDIRGMKMLSESASNLEVYKASGATPVFMGIADAYMALERGLGEGITCPWAALRVFGLTETVKHHVEVSFGVPQCFVIMNSDKWNSLPPDIQKVIMDLSPWASETVCNSIKGEELSVQKQSLGLGHTIYKPTPEELKLWDVVFATGAEKWIKEQEARGMPAKKLYEDVRQLALQYR